MSSVETELKTSVRLVVFDWAGTLVDFGSQAPVHVLQTLFAKRGVPITAAQAREPMGASKRDHIAALLGMPEVSQRWEMHRGAVPGEAEVDRLYAEFLPLQKELLQSHSTAIPGAVELVQLLRQNQIVAGSTTGYTRELMDILEPAAQSQRLTVDFSIASDEVSSGRPSPEMIQRVMSLAGIDDPSEVLKVDDTIVGIKAAQNAGCRSVAVAASGNSLGLTYDEYCALDPQELESRLGEITDAFHAAGADYVIDTIADLPKLLASI
ncbi:phosphonoacetaldehyde hydrolase [bacterium]|nr:phosphonoacetaldehyde hydrolase [bacterium]